MLLEFQKLGRESDVGLQEILRIQGICLLVAAVLLDIQSDCRSRTASSGKTDDDARAVGELDVESLVGRDASV